MSQPFITGVIVDRTETRRRGQIHLNYTLTFEYADRVPVYTATDDVQWVQDTLDALGVPDRAATLLLQRGGYIARVAAQK